MIYSNPESRIRVNRLIYSNSESNIGLNNIIYSNLGFKIRLNNLIYSNPESNIGLNNLIYSNPEFGIAINKIICHAFERMARHTGGKVWRKEIMRFEEAQISFMKILYLVEGDFLGIKE